MTVLVAFQGDGFTVIGADSRATDWSGNSYILSNPKVTTDEYEHYIYAVTGATRGGNLLQQGFDAPTPPVWQDINELDKFMTREFIPQLRDVFVDSGYEGINLDGKSVTHDTNFLVSVQGVISPIMEDYSWDRDLRGIYAGGSGGEIAKGYALGAGIEKCRKNPVKARAIIKKAIEEACKWNAYCALPVVIEVQKCATNVEV